MQTREKFEYLRFGEVRPEGWIRSQMERDLAGFTGHLDELVPDLILNDDIYGTDRLSRKIKSKDVGNIKEDADWEVQYLWWNSETQSNWRDGLIRQAILTGDTTQLARMQAYVDHILATQDSSGYLGIYDKNLRYRFTGENGELWAKATLLRGLLAWCESGLGDTSRLLSSIERAVKDVMIHYPIGRSHPFRVEKSFAGVCHGLVFTDVLDRLHQLTGNREYLDYAAFLYRDYSDSHLMEEDVCLDNILNPRYKLKGHGVHTYEHLRPLAVAAYATGDRQLRRALETYLRRIDSVTAPSGGPIGDEWIAGRKADATQTGYEYCSLQELLDSYALLMQKSGKALFGDKIEKLFFNAAQGARHPVESSVAYCKTDNSWQMTGPLNDTIPAPKQTRYKYSPAHQDVAVCCVPNAGRIAPYYVRSMWLRSPDGLVAALYGPSMVKTAVKGRQVAIREETGYPDDFIIRFHVTVEQPVRFKMRLRLPDWCSSYAVSLPFQKARGYLVIDREWKDGDSLELVLQPEIAARRDLNKDVYFEYGPLVLAHPVRGTEKAVKAYPLPGFRDLQVSAAKPDRYVWQEGDPVTVRKTSPPGFEASLFNIPKNRQEKVELVPMAGTVLRQVTFPVK